MHQKKGKGADGGNEAPPDAIAAKAEREGQQPGQPDPDAPVADQGKDQRHPGVADAAQQVDGHHLGRIDDLEQPGQHHEMGGNAKHRAIVRRGEVGQEQADQVFPPDHHADGGQAHEAAAECQRGPAGAGNARFVPRPGGDPDPDAAPPGRGRAPP